MQEMLGKAKLSFANIKREPKELFKFFKDLAEELVKGLKTSGVSANTRENLSQEFYIVCLLNALFGNPNIHLVQLHPAFRQGPNTFERALKLFGESFVFGGSLENDKKRKNALTEVLRFICHQEHPASQAPANGDAIYDRALEYLMSGDVKGGVTFLTKGGKPQMAQRVISCFNNPTYQASMA